MQNGSCFQGFITSATNPISFPISAHKPYESQKEVLQNNTKQNKIHTEREATARTKNFFDGPIRECGQGGDCISYVPVDKIHT